MLKGFTTTITDLRAAPLKDEKQITQKADEIISKIKSLQTHVQYLQSSKKIIGTSQDTKTIRAKTKETINALTLELKHITESLDNLEKAAVVNELRVHKREIIQALRKSYHKELTEATALMKEIKRLESFYVQSLRASIQSRQEESQSLTVSFEEQQQCRKSTQFIRLDLEEELIIERERDIRDLRGLMEGMRDLATVQAYYIRQQGEELEVAAGNVTNTKKNIKAAEENIVVAKKYKDNTEKPENKILKIIVGTCLTVIIIAVL